MGKRSVNRRLVLLLAILIVFLPSCALSSPDPSYPEAAVFPPEQTLPTGLPPNSTMRAPIPLAATAPDPETAVEPMPTAIARLIAAVFPTDEATVTPLPTPIPTPIPSPTAKPCDESGKIVTGTYESKYAGISPYRIYLPPCYEDKGHVYPTLYMLPGNIHTDSVWDNLGLDDAAEAAIQRGDIPPLLIVMAAGGQLANNTSGGPYSYESVIMEDLIPYIESNYCAWQEADGRAIGGMSRGGYWSLEIAFRHPDQFASVGGHSASLYDLYGGPDVIPQATGLANELGDLRVYFDVGENDWVIPNLRKLHEDMESAGKAHVWVVNEGWHEDAYWASHTKEYITWYSKPWPMSRDDYPLCSLAAASQSR